MRPALRGSAAVAKVAERLARSLARWVEDGGPPRGIPLWKALVVWAVVALAVSAVASAVGYSAFWEKWKPVRRYQAEARAWERAVARDRADVGAWLNLAWARFQLGDLGRAEEALRQAEALQPDDVMLDYYLGVVLAERAARAGRGAAEARRWAAEAEERLRRVFERFPDNPLPPFRLAELYERTGRAREAVELLDDIVERIDPTLADVYALRGRAHEAVGERNLARQDYLRALALDPSLGEAREAARRVGVPDGDLPPLPMKPRAVRPTGGSGWEALWYRR